MRDMWGVRPTGLPLVISHVCGIWRDVANKCSSLWTSVAIQRSSAVAAPATSHVHDSVNGSRVGFPLAQLYLQRSGEQPVNVEIVVRPPPSFRDWWTRRHAYVLSDLLLPHAGRFKRLVINHHSWECHRILWERIFAISMPILEDLQFYHFSLRDADEVFATGGLAPPKAELCPSLKDMIIGVPCRWQGFRQSNLTSLSFARLLVHHCPKIQELVEILRLSKDTLDKVEILGAFEAGDSGASFSPGERLSLPNVRMLRLGFYNARDLRPLLHRVAFPALRALVIINMYGEDAFGGYMRDLHALCISHLFDTMIRFLPLSQITFLILRYVCFREERFPAWASFQRGCVEEKHLPTPLRFMASLTSLRHLFLISPDTATLTSMNYPMPLMSTEDSVSRLPLVLPNLSFLRIMALSPKNYRNIFDWIVQRHSVLRAALSERYHVGPFLRRMHLCLPEDAQATVDALGYPGLACEETVSYRPGIHQMKYPVMHDDF